MVWQGKYKHKGISLEALIALIGSTKEEFDKFMKYRTGLIEMYIQKGGRISRV